MLSQYAKDNNYQIFDWYIDDGWSGVNFERPNFKRMISDIQHGHINTVITKDLSRFGRNYLAAGEYIEEFFPAHDVRYIAIHDMVDTKNGYNEFASLKNMFNDWYSMDISRKIRAAYKTKGRQGLFTSAFAPLGYIKDPDNRHRLIPDPETAHIVQRIFYQAAQGMGMYAIAEDLSNDKILCPSAYWNRLYGLKMTASVEKHPCHWSIPALRYLLTNKVYLGHLESGKWTTASHKNRKQYMTPKDTWHIVYDTHQPLVDKLTFELAGKRIGVRKRQAGEDGKDNIFAGLLRCADCGRVMAFGRKADKKKTIIYNCARYRSDGKEFCSAHYLRCDVLYSMLLDDIREKSDFAVRYENKFMDMLVQLDREKRHRDYADVENGLRDMERRLKELDLLIQKTYEDNALGRLSDDRYAKMSAAYETEQKALTKQIADAKIRIAEVQTDNANFERFARIVRQYTDITELTPEMLNELIERIVVHECEYESGERAQKIDVYYNFVGILPS